MKLRLWPRRRLDEPAGEEPPAGEELKEEPTPAPAPPPVPEEEPPAPARARPGQPASAFARPYAPEEEATAALPPMPEKEPPEPARARPGQPASAFARPYAPEEEATAAALPAEPPAAVSLTIEEAKAAIRAAGGDVIQIGFLARAYLRQQEEEPAGREAAAARKRLCDLVAKRLEDRRLLAPEGRFELLEESPPRA